ncbi:hypothetical protein O7626_03910 [Micromonospora sp. WMMD1102]|uniref:hypothetical protein n=1 Tax=Micromonospora sp. WMMD1102 TaxID=3016105 RepID=UPI002415822F|nr:hypothetical protein [Micromonospora sp. WMMD1102]MDG4785083.1 hypothetical protein [Micromonospora sp. WMMD1102]
MAGSVWQTLAQFCAGVHDLDLRDVTGPGHGAMILTDAAEATAETWRARLGRGDLVGIAATELHGGSRVQEITTRGTAVTHAHPGAVVPAGATQVGQVVDPDVSCCGGNGLGGCVG